VRSQLRYLGFGEHSASGAVVALWQASWRASPGLSATALFAAVVLGVTGPLSFVAMGAVVSGLVGSHSSLWPAVVFLVTLVTVRAALPAFIEPVTNELVRRVDRQFRRRMMACVSAPLGISHLEDPEIRDLISSAEGVASRQGPGVGIRAYLNLINYKLAALGSVLLLAEYRWWLGVGVLLGATVIRRYILDIWFQTARALRGDVNGLRRVEYLRDLSLRPENAKEQQLFGLGSWLIGRHDAAFGAAMKDVWEQRRRIGRHMGAVDVSILLLAAAAGIPLILGLVSGGLSPARAVVLGGALSAISGLGGFMPDADFPIRYGCLAIPPLLELERRLTSTAKPKTEAARELGLAGRIEFHDVSFTYPDGRYPVLDGLDLAVCPGTALALAGANGAGKTTVIKLLAGLYEPSSGYVQVDGIDLRSADLSAWRRRLAVVFQDFARYQLSARDNVGFGELDLLSDAEALDDAARSAGVLDAIQQLPLGWESVLSRSYRSGADLSGGQWQRVALARALLAVRAGAKVLVLDEPTANLDARAEAEFYERMLDLTSGVTTILVSHRFGTVRRADRICVLQGGRLVEDGSHDELVASGGRYAQMFALQAERFVDD
jgi:ATP-binding cassette, subfamily B, bacterial